MIATHPEIIIDDPKVIWHPQHGGQEAFISSPFWETLAEGNRGGGKTDLLMMDFAQDVGQGWGTDWRGIIFRKTYKQLDDIISRSKKWFYQIFPNARYNISAHEWTFPDGEMLLFRYMASPDDYWNYHGQEFPYIGWDELTNWKNNECYDRMKACNRSSRKGIPKKYRSTTNPYGKGHNWVKNDFIDKTPNCVPIKTTGNLSMVRIRVEFDDNLALKEADPEYMNKITQGKNDYIIKAWRDGNWDITAGGMWDDLWDARVHVLKPFIIPSSWRIDRAFDWGSSKPFSVGWFAESDGTEAPNGVIYPRGTIFQIYEWYGWNGEPDTGLRMLSKDIAKGIKERETKWGIKVEDGPADSSIWKEENGNCIEKDMRKEGIGWKKSNRKPGSRILGWERFRELLSASLGERTPDNIAHHESAGFYVFDRCLQTLRTVPSAVRDEKNPDDLDTDTEDHTADMIRYRILKPSRGGISKTY